MEKVINFVPGTGEDINTNFRDGSTIVFNGIMKETTYISPEEITCRIGLADIMARSVTAYDYESLAGIFRKVPVLVRNSAPGGGDSNFVDFRIGSNNGFTVPVNISKNSGCSACPSIALDGTGNIYIVWVDVSNRKRDIFFSRLARNSTGWSNAVNLSRDPENSANPAITLDRAGNIYVVWYNYFQGNPQILFRRSTDNGSNWSNIVKINKDGFSEPYTPAIAASNGDIYVVWTEYISYSTWFEQDDIFFSRSKNNGKRWSKAVYISYDWFDQYELYSYSPALAVDSDGIVYLAWSDDSAGKKEIFFCRSTDI